MGREEGKAWGQPTIDWTAKETYCRTNKQITASELATRIVTAGVPILYWFAERRLGVDVILRGHFR